MRFNKYLIVTLILIFVSGCAPSIYYLGESYNPVKAIDIYYDEADIQKKYITIGQLTHDKFMSYSVKQLKEALIQRAKTEGADGIVFLDTDVTRHNQSSGDRLSIKSKLIRYIDTD
jgi:hypothetical protein